MPCAAARGAAKEEEEEGGGDVPGGHGPAAGAAAGGVAGGQGHEPPAAGPRLGRQPRNLRHAQRRPLVSDRRPPSPPACLLPFTPAAWLLRCLCGQLELRRGVGGVACAGEKTAACLANWVPSLCSVVWGR